MSGFQYNPAPVGVPPPTPSQEVASASPAGAPDLMYLGGDTPEVGSVVLVPLNGGTPNQPADRETTVPNGIVDASTVLAAINQGLEAPAAGDIQPGAGNVLHTFAIRVDSGVTMVGDIASNTDGNDGWRLAIASGGKLTAFVRQGGVTTVAAIESMPERGLLAGDWQMASILIDRDGGFLYVADDRAEPALINASRVALAPGNLDNTGKYVLGNGLPGGGGGVGFAGSSTIFAARWTGAQLDGFDGATLAQHHRALRPLLCATLAQQYVGAAAMETITRAIHAGTLTRTTTGNGVGTTNLTAGVKVTLQIFTGGSVDKTQWRDSGRIVYNDLTGITTYPSSFQGHFTFNFFASGRSSTANTKCTIEVDLGVNFTATPDSGTVLSRVTLEQEVAAGADVMDWQVFGRGLVPLAGGQTLQSRVQMVADNNTTITWLPNRNDDVEVVSEA